MGAKRIELTGFSDTEVELLKSFGFFGEIIAWRLAPVCAARSRRPASRLCRASSCSIRPFAARPQVREECYHELRNRLSRRLAAQAEAVCPAYLPPGRRRGRYWIVGDVQGTPGQSLFVKLFGDGAGHWLDAATGEHGDLLDLIRLTKGLHDFRETLEEARRFLREPAARPQPRTSLLLEAAPRHRGRRRESSPLLAPRNGHARRDLSAPPRASPRNFLWPSLAVPPRLLLPPR